MKKRMKIKDHVDVLCIYSFDEFIQKLKETRRAIMTKHPETKESDFSISVGPFNHCVHVNFRRWATEEEIKERIEHEKKQKKEIRKEIEAFYKENPFNEEEGEER